MLISGLIFFGWLFCFLSGWGGGTPVMAVCCLSFWPSSAGVFTGNSCWYWRLGNWDELGEEMLEEKVLVIC